MSRLGAHPPTEVRYNDEHEDRILVPAARSAIAGRSRLRCMLCGPLAAIAIGAGAASTIAAIAEPVAGVLLATGPILGIAIYVRRRNARAAAACATDGSCGCGPSEKRSLYTSPDPVADAPIACTVDLRDKNAVQAGMDKYRGAFIHLVSTERTSNGFRWRFRATPGLETQLTQLAASEHSCCSFMKFDIAASGSEIVWTTTADASAQSVVEEYMRLPEMLRAEPRPGHDVTSIKERVVRAGITFTSDAR